MNHKSKHIPIYSGCQFCSRELQEGVLLQASCCVAWCVSEYVYRAACFPSVMHHSGLFQSQRQYPILVP